MIHEIHLHDGTGALHAMVTVVRNPFPKAEIEHKFGNVECRTTLEALRHVPLDVAIVRVYYPRLSRNVVININPLDRETPMDLSNIFNETSSKDEAPLPQRLLAPLPAIMPTDSVVRFQVVETLRDVLDAPESTVLLFAEDNFDLLDCVVKNPRIMGFNSFVLSGVPSADYSPKFESLTWQCERVSFPAFVNELIEHARVEKALADENPSNYQKERKQYTRASGHVKELTGIKLAGAPDATEEATGTEE